MKSTLRSLRHTLRPKPVDPSVSQTISLAIAFAALVALLIHSSDAHGAVRQYTTPIQSVLVGPNYNGCLIKVNEVDWALECTNRDGYTWLTLDCDGEWMSLATAKNNLQQARIALLTGNQLSVVVDDRFITDGGYCLAKQTTMNAAHSQ